MLLNTKFIPLAKPYNHIIIKSKISHLLFPHLEIKKYLFVLKICYLLCFSTKFQIKNLYLLQNHIIIKSKILYLLFPHLEIKIYLFVLKICYLICSNIKFQIKINNRLYKYKKDNLFFGRLSFFV